MFAESTEPEVILTSTDVEFNLDFTQKKKKKKKKHIVNVDAVADDGHRDDAEHVKGGDNDTGGHTSWTGCDREYAYHELLARVYDIMRDKNPDMIVGEIRTVNMRPPQVLRLGTRKTSFVNFADICRLLYRHPKHVLAFLLAELGTSGSINGHNQLIINGRYTEKHIENVLRRYIREYVMCHTCRSRNTLLQKETRMFFLQCETCGSRCSVASIKTGFQAVTRKRAAIRAKSQTT